MMSTRAIVIGGYHDFGTQEITLTHMGSLYIYFLSATIEVKFCDIKTRYELSNYLMSYTLTDVKILYIIYVGHGEGKNDVEYPYISPFETIDISATKLINNNGEVIETRIIYNCCNVKDINLTKHKLSCTISSDVVTRISKFLDMDFRYICLRKGLQDSGLGNRTMFASAFIDTMINYRYSNIDEFLTILNYNVGVLYKRENKINNNRVKKYIESSERFNSTSSKDFINTVKVDDVGLPDDYMTSDTKLKLIYVDHHAKNSDNVDVFGHTINSISI